MMFSADIRENDRGKRRAVKNIDRRFKRTNLLNVLTDDKRETAGSQNDDKGVLYRVMVFMGFSRVQSASACFIKKFSKPLWTD